MSGRKVHTNSTIEPYLTPSTCTDPTCDGSCGRASHPAAVPADAEVAGCG
jgi:hypothetical protein